MKARSLSTEASDGVLTITLDTPACSVNIFTHEAAVQLIAILSDIDAGTRAVVFRSAKPHSFVNGASLMLASAVGKPEDLVRLTAPIRRAYQMLGDLEIPTIAAVRGSCYGCGVELALRCKYRVAGDSYDAHFYMTEIADYLLVPTFGSTQYLPHILGLENATDFLLWGERWSAQEALERGLIHGYFTDHDFDASVRGLAADLARGATSSLLRVSPPAPRTDIESFGRRTRERIHRLPPEYRDVYDSCYALIERAARSETLRPDDLEAEVRESARSVVAPISKASVGFFFVRQLNEQVTLRGAAPRSTFRVACDMATEAPRFLRAELQGRRIRDVTFEDHAGAAASPDTLQVVAYGKQTVDSGSGQSVAISTALELAAPDFTRRPVLYVPAWRHGLPFVEIACPVPSEAGQTAFRLLGRAGITGITTRPGEAFVTNQLLRGFLRPQIAFLAAGGKRRDLGATLLEFGFTRLPGDWLRGWDLASLARLLDDTGDSDIEKAIVSLPSAADSESGTAQPSLQNAVLASLLAFARRALDDGSARHPSTLDVAARMVIDFPLGKTSLCRYLTVARAKMLQEQVGSIAPLIPGESIRCLSQYVKGAADFYL